MPGTPHAHSFRPIQPYAPTHGQQYANIGVVLGVVGGLCLVAIVVAVVVPIVRRRVRRRTSILSGCSPGGTAHFYYRKARTNDVAQDEHEMEMYLPPRRSSLHQKMFSGPESKPLLPLILDPLRPISAITWPDLRSGSKSPAPSTDTASTSDSDQPPFAHRDIPHDSDHGSLSSTNRATTSHRTMSRSTKSSGGEAIEDGARSSLPPPHRSPTPPGLPSKRGSQHASARRASLPITPISPYDSSPSPSRDPRQSGMPLFAPMPTASTSASSSYNPLSPVSPLTSANVSRSSSYARSMTHKVPGMDPVPEDADTGEYAETRSLQLPSPPASPDQSPYAYDSRSRSSATASTSGRRPSLTGRQSAPNALPFRPRSSTGPIVPLPLTAAFQTSVLRSGSGSASSTTPSNGASNAGTSHGQRYPSITTSPPRVRERSRPSSVSVSMSTSRASPPPSRAPDGQDGDMMARPIESFRRLSTTDIRHRHPYASQSGTDENGESSARAFLRSSDALRVPHVQHATPGPSSHRQAVVYNPPPPPQTPPVLGPSFTTPPPNPLSPPALGPMPTPMRQGGSSTGTGSGSGAPRLTVQTSQHHRALGMGGGHPSAVTWKSLASGSRGSLSSQQSSHLRGSGAGTGSDGLPRSRSNSVRSVRALPVPPVQAQLPPLDPVTPLSLSLEGLPECETTDGQLAHGGR